MQNRRNLGFGRIGVTWLAALGISLQPGGQAFAQESANTLAIGIIDTYGRKLVSVDEIRGALTFSEGDRIAMERRPDFIPESEARLTRLPNVSSARISIVCCEAGALIVWIGIQEHGAAPQDLRAKPTGAIPLPSTLVADGEAFERALVRAIRAGQSGEDTSRGHSLANDPDVRSVQMRFLNAANRNLPLLRQVLRDASDERHRALAAQVLGYVSDKQSVVADLTFAMRDPDAGVRNNAMRALSIFASLRPESGGGVQIAAQPFVECLNSPIWTDRNKAAAALVALTERRDQAILATLRARALDALIEMARWKSESHALPAVQILGRIAGLPEAVIQEHWGRKDREFVIDSALRSH